MIGQAIWAVRVAVWWVRDLLRRRRRTPERVAFLLETPPPELDPPRPPVWQRFLSRPPLSLQGLGRQLRAVAAEPRVRAVALHLRPMELSAAQVEGLRELIAEVRAAGKRVTCWAPGYTAQTYCVACAADEVLLQPGGLVAPLGLVREHLFLTDALDRVGVRVDLLQVSPYKTAGDQLTRRGLTPEAREMADWLADAALTDRLEAIAAGRTLDEAAAGALVDRSPLTDQQAVTEGAVDGLVSEEDLTARMGGEVRSWGSARRRLPRPRPVRPGRVVALLRIEGMIVDGRSRRAPFRPPLAPPLLFQDQCGDLTVVEQARGLAVDRRVGAVVLWVDSPGGSASASESMAAALATLAARKPVVAVMGPVAASGGYYVTTPAARVFARSGTITGSIGVLAGKVVAGGLLDRLLVRRELTLRGEHSAMWGAEAPFTEAERRWMGEFIGRSYGLFLERVAAGRRRPVAEIEPLAGGRVWTGRQARERGLVDELGGLAAGLAAARRLAGLREDAPLREARRGRGELAVLPATAPAAVEHALRAVAALRQAGAWWLCPLVSEE